MRNVNEIEAIDVGSETTWETGIIDAHAPGQCACDLDRLDHLRRFNQHAPDDGITGEGKPPGRSLMVSWHTAMKRLAPIFHEAGKVILGNPIGAYRIDVIRHLDGIYDEYRSATNIDRDAFLCVRKPLTIWSAPQGDEGFQEALYLAAFPSVPFPGNDHNVEPDPALEQQFLDYGPLLNAVRGKKWVLLPHVISVENQTALANLFETPYGYAAPVMFGGGAARAKVAIRGLPIKPERIDALQPGSESAVPVASTFDGDTITLDVPLARGCALVRLTRAAGKSAEGNTTPIPRATTPATRNLIPDTVCIDPLNLSADHRVEKMIIAEAHTLLEFSSVFRVYDATTQLPIPTTLDRTSEYLTFHESSPTILNFDDEVYIAAAIVA